MPITPRMRGIINKRDAGAARWDRGTRFAAPRVPKRLFVDAGLFRPPYSLLLRCVDVVEGQGQSGIDAFAEYDLVYFQDPGTQAGGGHTQIQAPHADEPVAEHFAHLGQSFRRGEVRVPCLKGFGVVRSQVFDMQDLEPIFRR